MPPGRPTEVNDIKADSSSSVMLAGNTLYFTISGQLWRSDGTAAGTQQVERTGAIQVVRFLGALDDILYFTASDSSHGNELWRTDGTLAGTWLVRDIFPGVGNSRIESLVTLGRELFFGADDGIHGFELWKTDGTTEGTVLAVDLNPGPGGSELDSLRSVGNRLLFSESSGHASAKPSVLYVSDGSESGTRSLGQFATVSTSSICFVSCFGWPPGDFVSLAGLTYFIGSDAASGLELWQTDGTSSGTKLVKDICPSTCSAFVYSDGLAALDTLLLQVVNGRLFFFADDGVHGRELWTSDGTEAGTRLVKDIFPGPSSSSFGYGMTPAGSAVLFPADDGEHGYELWRSDGTEAGTFLVGDLNAKSDSRPEQITPVGDIVFFVVADDSKRSRLWKTDSAGSSVSLVSDAVVDPTSLANFGGRLYFTAASVAGFALWKTDGTTAGTVVVKVLIREPVSVGNPRGTQGVPWRR